jgi:hypothetical protein
MVEMGREESRYYELGGVNVHDVEKQEENVQVE